MNMLADISKFEAVSNNPVSDDSNTFCVFNITPMEFVNRVAEVALTDISIPKHDPSFREYTTNVLDLIKEGKTLDDVEIAIQTVVDECCSDRKECIDIVGKFGGWDDWEHLAEYNDNSPINSIEDVARASLYYYLLSDGGKTELYTTLKEELLDMLEK